MGCFTIQRVNLVGGVSTPIQSPTYNRAVSVGNAGTEDLLLYSKKDDDSAYVIIAAGWERKIDMEQSGITPPGNTVFWLKSSIDTTVVLTWA